MRRDFAINRGIYLSQPPYQLDLHNDFDFLGVDYSVETRTATLRWRRAKHHGVPTTRPASLTVTFGEVSEFRINARNSALPFSEDACVNAFGYWTDAEWTDGVILAEGGMEPEPHWLTAVEFMSGTVILVQAGFACARITD